MPYTGATLRQTVRFATPHRIVRFPARRLVSTTCGSELDVSIALQYNSETAEFQPTKDIAMNERDSLYWEVNRVRSPLAAPKPFNLAAKAFCLVAAILLVYVGFTLLDKWVTW